MTLLLGCLLLLTGCAIDPEHFDGLNPVPGAARKDVAYSEMRALRAVEAGRAGASAAAPASAVSAVGHDTLSWQPCTAAAGSTPGLQCGRLTVVAATATEPSVSLEVVRRSATEPTARQGVAVLPVGPGEAAGTIQPLAAAVVVDPSSRQLNRTFDLVTVQVRNVDDLDAVRVALGEQTWSLLGTGPAAAIVAAYVQAHPDRIRAAVLDRPDGAVPSASAAAPAAPQTAGTQTSTRITLAGTCSGEPAGPDALGVGAGALVAASAGCPAPPVLVVAGMAEAERAREVRAPEVGDAWGGILLTVADGSAGPSGPTEAPGAGSCVHAVENFILTLGLPTDGPCA